MLFAASESGEAEGRDKESRLDNWQVNATIRLLNGNKEGDFIEGCLWMILGGLLLGLIDERREGERGRVGSYLPHRMYQDQAWAWSELAQTHCAREREQPESLSHSHRGIAHDLGQRTQQCQRQQPGHSRTCSAGTCLGVVE